MSTASHPSARNQSVDAAEELAGVVFGEKDGALLHHGGEAVFVGAGVLQEGFD